MTPPDHPSSRADRCASGHEAAVITAFARAPRNVRSVPGRTKIGCARCAAILEPPDITLEVYRLLEAAHRLDNERDWLDWQTDLLVESRRKPPATT